MTNKLAIIVTHPIQYYAPVFKLLAQYCDLKVFYTWGEKGAAAKYDPNFKQVIDWDLPLLEGYDYHFLENTSSDPGSHHFKGIVNPTLVNQINDFAPHAILVYGWAYQSHLKVLRSLNGKIPIWFRGDSNLINARNGIKSILRSLYLKWIYQHVNKAFYVGTANKAYYKKFGLKESQLTFAPHAIDNDRFAEDRNVEREALRKSLGIAENDTLILFAGKLDQNKNPSLLLNAFVQLAYEKVHLLFVGNGVLEGYLKSQISNLKSYNVHFIDFQNQTQMPVVYQACNLFCMPSQSETWGLAVNEAMACGKAVLVADQVGCAQDLVKDGENGYTFKSGNIESLKNRLSLMLKSKKKLKEMGEKSAQLIKNWSFENQCASILNELNKLNENR